MSSKLFSKKMGQNTAEYMLLLLIIGGGSIVAFKVFGKGIINRFASVTAIITGGSKIDGKDIATEKEFKGKGVDFSTFEDPESKK